jgi:hypothetical protein
VDCQYCKNNGDRFFRKISCSESKVKAEKKNESVLGAAHRKGYQKGSGSGDCLLSSELFFCRDINRLVL